MTTENERRVPDFPTDQEREQVNALMVDPDKSWRATLIDRYRSCLRAHGLSDEVGPLEDWSEGSPEITEIFLRSRGFPHVA